MLTFNKVTVDGIDYRVFINFGTIKRKFEIMEKENKGVAITGRNIRDILGTNYSYSFTVSPNPMYPQDYDLFYDKISEPVDSHMIEAVYGQSSISFEAMITSGEDDFDGNESGTNLWKSLTVHYDPMEPQRT